MSVNAQLSRQKSTDNYLEYLAKHDRRRTNAEQLGRSEFQPVTVRMTQHVEEMPVFNVTAFFEGMARRNKESATNLMVSMASVASAKEKRPISNQYKSRKVITGDEGTSEGTHKKFVLSDLIRQPKKLEKTDTFEMSASIPMAPQPPLRQGQSGPSFGGRYWRSVSQKFQSAWDAQVPVFQPRARAGFEDFLDNQDIYMALRANCTPNDLKGSNTQDLPENSRPRALANFKSVGHFRPSPDPFVVNKQLRAIGRLMQTSVTNAGTRPKRAHRILPPQQEGSSGQGLNTHTSEDAQRMDSMNATVLTHFVDASMDGRSHLRFDKSKDTESRYYYERLNKTSKDNLEAFMANSLDIIRDIDYAAIFKQLQRKVIDCSGFNVMDTDSSERLPQSFLFANRFQFTVVNVEGGRIVHTSAELLRKTHWLKLSDSVTIPSVRDIVDSCCADGAEVALVLFEVE